MRVCDPGPLFRPVTLPVHQVLESPPTPARLQEATDSEGGTSIDEARRRWRWHNRDQSALSGRFNPEYVKRGMDTHGSGGLELHRHQVDDLLDLKWTDEPRGQFLGLHPEGKVTVESQKPLTRLVVWALERWRLEAAE